MNSPADNTVPSYLMGDASETLLNIKNRGDDSKTGTWLASLVTDALEIAAHGDADQPVTDQDLDVMVKWVAEIFNEFELYKIEFNMKAAGSDLLVVASPLNLESLSATNDHFEAHLSTRRWSLAFDASTRKLDLYMIPSELLLAFTTSRIEETEYQPFITFIPRRHRDEYFWSVQQRTITFDMLPKLAKELFSDLIRVASGNISEEEFFKNAPNEVAAAASHAAEIDATDRSYEAAPSGADSGSASIVLQQGQTDRGVASAAVNLFNSASSALNARPAESINSFASPNPSNAMSAETNAAVEQPAPATRDKALSDAFFARCAEFSSYIESEMQAVIDYARTQPDNVQILQHCKEIINEMQALRGSTSATAQRLRQLL